MAKFIVNYLMMTYGVRNMDVDVEIVKSKKAMTDEKQNYSSKNKGMVTLFATLIKLSRLRQTRTRDYGSGVYQRS
jgi:hypothetical protein